MQIPGEQSHPCPLPETEFSRDGRQPTHSTVRWCIERRDGAGMKRGYTLSLTHRPP